MEDSGWIDERIQQLYLNIRAEVILAEILDSGMNPDDIVIAPVGISKRPFSNDLLKSQWVELKSGKLLYYFYITREGLYDAIPEGIIHQPATVSPNASSNSMVDSVKKGRQEEEEARNFFLPFEQEFYYQRIAIEKEERKLLSELKENSSELFVNFWKLDDCLDATQKAILLNILPISHKIVGNNDLTSQSFEMVLGTKVSIRHIEPIIKSAAGADIASLGDAILGANLVLGKEFYDGEPAIEIAIGPLKNDRLMDFIPGGRGNEVFDFLCHFFIPVELDIKRKIIVDEGSFDYTLNKSKEKMRLGFNGTLGNSKKSKLKDNFA